MRVLLIYPNSEDLAVPAYWPPLGILYVAAALQSHDHDVRVIDMALDPIPSADYAPELIGVSCNTPNYLAVRDVIKICRERWPGVRIVVGGPHVRIVPEDGARLGADITVSGDGEEVMLALADDLSLPEDRLVNVNQWPIPARNLIDLDRYAAYELGGKSTSLITSRGCPYQCAYCAKWPGYGQVRFRGLDNVVKEVEELRARGYQSLRFFDDELNLNEDRLLALCESIKPLNVEWTCLVRANLFNERQAAAMVDAGCRMVQMGIESGSDAILKNVRSAKTVADNTNARRVAREAGLQFWAFFVVGLPGESHSTIQETRRWIVENRPDMFSVYTFQPFPGTRIHDRSNEFDIQFPRPLPYDQIALGIRGTAARPLHCLVSTSSLS